MTSRRKNCFLTFAGSLALALSVPVIAQESANLASSDPPRGTPSPAANADNNWHLGSMPYLWFAGVHGSVGARGVTASVHASPSDVLSKLNIGLMGATEARKKRFVVPVDFMWIKLSDDKAFPGIGSSGANSIKAKMISGILSPKVGYRFVDSEKLQANALIGIRYWHLGTTLTLQPADFTFVSQSANWVDVVAGARFVVPLSPKAMIMVLGDAGGGGANLDYQVAGLLGYSIKPTIILQAGWRYLDVNDRPSSGFVYDVRQSGLQLGVTIHVK